MYKRLLLVVVILLISVTVSQAQEGAWPIVQNCMGDLTYPIIPSTKWDFPGVIVSSVYPEGLRGIRADLDVEYFVALEADDSFPIVGAVSPDGQYFAYPVGGMQYRVNELGESLFDVDQVGVVRTDGDTREKYLFAGNANTYGMPGIGALTVPPMRWFGSDWIYYPPEEDGQPALTNFKTGKTQVWTPAVSPDELRFISPDGTHAFSTTLYDLQTDQALDYPTPATVVWLADSSAFIATDTALEIVDRDGSIIAAPWPQPVRGVAAAPNGKAIAFWDEQYQLYLADVDTQTIYDLCFTGKNGVKTDFSDLFSNLAWSPDSSALAFSYDGYVVILNTQTLANQVLNHHSIQVMGWYPLAGETIEPVTGIPSPAPLATLVPTATPTKTPTLTPTHTPTITPTATPTATFVPQADTCVLEVLIGVNLRAGAGADTEKVGSAAAGSGLQADAQQLNESDHFRWWRLTTGEWIREDFVKEDANCAFLPEAPKP